MNTCNSCSTILIKLSFSERFMLLFMLCLSVSLLVRIYFKYTYLYRRYDSCSVFYFRVSLIYVTFCDKPQNGYKWANNLHPGNANQVWSETEERRIGSLGEKGARDGKAGNKSGSVSVWFNFGGCQVAVLNVQIGINSVFSKKWEQIREFFAEFTTASLVSCHYIFFLS